MSMPQRNRIVWLDRQAPKEIEALAQEWAFELADSSEFRSKTGLGGLLAVFIPTAVLTSIAPSDLLNASNHGVLCIVVTKGSGESASFEAAAADGELRDKERRFGCDLSFVRVMPAEPSTLLRECLRHEGGSSPNIELKIVNGDNLDADATSLIQRVFASFHEVTLRRLDGGRSGSGDVWQVDASKADGRCAEPFIIKIGDREALMQERDQYDNCVRHYVPFPCRPSLMKGGTLRSARKAILSSMFVTRAQRFDDYVRSVHCPELAITALFVSAMRTWRATRQKGRGALGVVYADDEGPTRVLPRDPHRLYAAYRLAQAESVLDPCDLFKLLRDIPPTDYHDCWGHGDLNARNAFVRSGGADVVLIDFSHVSFMPASRDPARLEVCLAFDIAAHNREFIDDCTLRELYRQPIIPCEPTRGQSDGRLAAIRQIRCHVAGEGISRSEYEVSVAVHLLRYAREASIEQPNTAIEIAGAVGSDEELRLRRTAYVCASEILRRHGSGTSIS